MTPKEIAEYIYSEFTPLSKMSQEEAMLHVEQLIQQSNGKAVKDWIMGNTAIATVDTTLIKQSQQS